MTDSAPAVSLPVPEPHLGRPVPPARTDDCAVCWVRSPGDLRCHAVTHHDAAGVTTTGEAQALCGVALSRQELDLAAQPSSPLCSWCVTGATAEPPRFAVT
ncbi:MAG: hypothetical protein ACRDTC_06405 [Pseudonocardiaceae bacterium]